MSKRDDEKSKKPKDEEKPGTSKEYDPALDLTHKLFDPLKALYSDNVIYPVPNARPLDNLAKYESLQKRFDITKTAFGESEVMAKSKNMASSSAPKPSSSQPERRFLPHQEPVRGKPRKEHSDMIQRMRGPIEGPLSGLKKCLNPGTTVTIYIRRAHEVRGTLTGTLQAFDKHWNLALSDATERWTRKNPKKIKNPLEASENPHQKENRIRVPIPETRIISSNAKVQVCERSVRQMMVRGEQVVLIILHAQAEGKTKQKIDKKMEPTESRKDEDKTQKDKGFPKDQYRDKQSCRK